jgi:hypothetical protein
MKYTSYLLAYEDGTYRKVGMKYNSGMKYTSYLLAYFMYEVYFIPTCI